MSTVFRRASASKYSAIQSCGSICVVYGFQVRLQRLDEAARERRPVDLRIGDEMRVEVADRAVDLAGDRDGREARALLGQAMHEVGDFLAQRRRRRGLAMSARHHGNGSVGMRERAQPADQRVEARQQHLVARVAQHQRVAQVVDVLGRAREVHELAPRAPGRHRVEAGLDEVLDRLHVVIGLALDALDLRGLGFGQIRSQGVQRRQGLRGQATQLDDARLGGQRLQPERLDAHPLADQPALAEERPQLGCLVGVAAVDRGDGVERAVVHGYLKR